MKRPLKNAAVCGILIIAVGIFTSVFQYFQSSNIWFNQIFNIVNLVLGIVFMNGFLHLGKKFKSKMLVVMSWIGIIFSFVFAIFAFVGNASAQELAPELMAATLLLIFVVASILFGAYSILFGIGLMKIGNKVEKARTTGIVQIVSGATMIILVGWFISIAAFVLQIILLFKASKKFEKK